MAPDTDANGAQRLASLLREALGPTLTIGGSTVPSTLSIGMSIVTEERPIDQVLRDADAALYVAKAQGRDRAVLSSDVRPEVPQTRSRRRPVLSWANAASPTDQ